MKLIQLRYLVAVAENDLNITQAARTLHAAQPGVSKQLKQLEDELGFQIFERKGRALLRPTDAGNQVIDRATQIVRQARNIKMLAADLRKDDAGDFSIATTHTQARYVLPQVLKKFRDRYPKVRLHLHRIAAGKVTNLDQLLALGGFEKGEFRPARRFVPALFFQTENLAIELDRALEVVDAVAGVQELFGQTHGGSLTGILS